MKKKKQVKVETRRRRWLNRKPMPLQPQLSFLALPARNDPQSVPVADSDIPEGDRRKVFELTKLLDKLLAGHGDWALCEDFRRCVRIARALTDKLEELPGMPDKPERYQNTGTLEEIKAFCTEQKIPESDAQWFYFKMIGNGWKVGGVRLKCWRSVVRCWNKGGFFPSQRPLPNGNGNGRAAACVQTLADKELDKVLRDVKRNYE